MPDPVASPEEYSLTVVVVSDFEAGEKTWADEIAMMRALAAQDYDCPFRVIIGESEAHKDMEPPAALFAHLPDVEIVYSPSDLSAAIKDYAVSQCKTEWVAVFEADALPEPQWLRLTMEAALANQDCAIVSGRTWYGDETMWRRVLNLIGRSFDDLGRSDESIHVSNNGALYRTSIIQDYPYPEATTPFLSAPLRTFKMRDDGVKFYSEREARTRHAIGGLDFVLDVHRNIGFTDMMLPKKPSYWIIPRLTLERIRNQIGCALRVGGEYLKPLDWPLWAAMMVFIRFPEWRGMHEALQKTEKLEGSAYR